MIALGNLVNKLICWPNKQLGDSVNRRNEYGILATHASATSHPWTGAKVPSSLGQHICLAKLLALF